MSATMSKPGYEPNAGAERICYVQGAPVVLGLRRQRAGTLVSLAVQKPESEGGGLVILTEAEARATLATLQALLSAG